MIKNILSAVKRPGVNKIYRLDFEKYLILYEFRDKIKSNPKKNVDDRVREKKEQRLNNNTQLNHNLNIHNSNFSPNSQNLNLVVSNAGDGEKNKFMLSELKQYWINKFFYILEGIGMTVEEILKQSIILSNGIR